MRDSTFHARVQRNQSTSSENGAAPVLRVWPLSYSCPSVAFIRAKTHSQALTLHLTRIHTHPHAPTLTHTHTLHFLDTRARVSVPFTFVSASRVLELLARSSSLSTSRYLLFHHCFCIIYFSCKMKTHVLAQCVDMHCRVVPHCLDSARHHPHCARAPLLFVAIHVRAQGKRHYHV